MCSLQKINFGLELKKKKKGEIDLKIYYQAGTAEYTEVQTSCLCKLYYRLQEK